MKRTPLHDLSRDELIGLVLRLQKQLTDLEKRNVELAAQNEELGRRIEELEKKNPTVQKSPGPKVTGATRATKVR